MAIYASLDKRRIKMPTVKFQALNKRPAENRKNPGEAAAVFSGGSRPVAMLPKIPEVEILLTAIKEREENTFQMTNVESLADSIYDYGLIEPITVWQKEGDHSGIYTISAGHRRFKAFQYLHEKHPDDPRFKTIAARAYIVTSSPELLAKGEKYISEETEKGMYLDSNFQSRQISYNDTLQYVDYLIERIEKNSADQIKALELQEANRESIQRHSKKINKSEFIAQMIAEQNYDKWSAVRCRKYLLLRDRASADERAKDLVRRIHLPEGDSERLSVSVAYKIYNSNNKKPITTVKSIVKKIDDINYEIANGRTLTPYERKALSQLQEKIENLLQSSQLK